jgi:hypothetical protein
MGPGDAPHRMSIRPKHLEHAAEGFKLGWIGTTLSSSRSKPTSARPDLARNSQSRSDLCRRLSYPDDGLVVPAAGRVARKGAGTVVAGRLRDGRRVGHEQGGLRQAHPPSLTPGSPCRPRPGVKAGWMLRVGYDEAAAPILSLFVADLREERVYTGQATITPVAIAKH